MICRASRFIDNDRRTLPLLALKVVAYIGSPNVPCGDPSIIRQVYWAGFNPLVTIGDDSSRAVRASRELTTEFQRFKNPKRAEKCLGGEIQATPEQLAHSGHDLDEVSIGVAQKSVAVVLADVVGRLDDGSAGGCELIVGFVDVVDPYD